MKHICAALRRALRLLALPARRQWVMFVFMFLLLLVCRDFEHCKPEAGGEHYFVFFFDLYALCLLLCLLPRRLQRAARGVAYLVAYGLAVAESFCVERFNLFFSPTTLQLLLETNSREAGEFVSAYVWSPALWHVAWVYGLLALANVATAVYGRRALRLLDRHFRGGRVASLAADVAIPALLLYSATLSLPEKRQMLHFLGESNTTLTERTEQGMFYCPFYRAVYALKYLQVSHNELQLLRGNMRRLRVDSCSHRVPNIVLVIGESYNKHHSALYGYRLNTTPYQCLFARHGSLVAFADVVTPWNVTSNAFKNFMSTHGGNPRQTWADGVLFPALFRRAGYRTAFISSQFYKSPNLGATDFNGSFFMNDAELDSMCFDFRNPYRFAYDGSLLAKLKDYRPADRNLIILHGMGQHQEYSKRCPAGKRHFSTADYGFRHDLSERERQIVADYDNATRYNDEVLARICACFAKQDAVVVFMPDHGEEVFDEIHNFGRDHNAVISAPLARNEFEIPFEMWFSRTFRRRHPDIVAAARRNSRRPFASDDLPHLLLGLAGISCPYYDARRDPLSPQFDASRKRWLKGHTDYDSLMTPYYKTHAR